MGREWSKHSDWIKDSQLVPHSGGLDVAVRTSDNIICSHSKRVHPRGPNPPCSVCQEAQIEKAGKRRTQWIKDGGRAVEAAWRENLRRQVIAHYGGKCVCCGEGMPEFLTFDHINGNGIKQRQGAIGYWTGGWRLALWLRAQGYPDGLVQVQCYNCNCARAFYGRGRCPHER